MWPSLFEKALSKYFKSFEAVGLGACSSNLVMNSRTFFQHEIDERIQEGMLAWPSLFSPVGHVSIPHTRTVPQVISTSCVAAGKPSKVFEFYDDKHAGFLGQVSNKVAGKSGEASGAGAHPASRAAARAMRLRTALLRRGPDRGACLRHHGHIRGQRRAGAPVEDPQPSRCAAPALRRPTSLRVGSSCRSCSHHTGFTQAEAGWSGKAPGATRGTKIGRK